jgi:hypothetical protein
MKKKFIKVRHLHDKWKLDTEFRNMQGFDVSVNPTNKWSIGFNIEGGVSDNTFTTSFNMRNDLEGIISARLVLCLFKAQLEVGFYIWYSGPEYTDAEMEALIAQGLATRHNQPN